MAADFEPGPDGIDFSDKPTKPSKYTDLALLMFKDYMQEY